jgi:hypothetical protein
MGDLKNGSETAGTGSLNAIGRPAETGISGLFEAGKIVLCAALFSDVSTQFFSGGRRERIRWKGGLNIGSENEGAGCC